MSVSYTHLDVYKRQENARMAKLYRKEVLQEPDAPAGFISLGDIKPAAAPAPARVEETVAGD